MNPLLEMKGIHKEYPGVRALDHVDFSVDSGEVHCLIGANGAGKSTLMKVLSGVVKKDCGDIFLEGNKVTIQNPIESKALGISIIYQELSLVEELSVCENIFLGDYLNKKTGFVNWRNMHKRAKELLSFMNVRIEPDELIKDLSMGKKQMVEIAKAIASDCKVMIMDEPSTALSEDEVNKLFHVIRDLKQRGLTIIYISHKLEELYAIGDRVTILRNGKWVVTESIHHFDKEEMIRHITGRDIIHKEKATTVQEREEFLKVENFKNKKLKGVSFSLGKGEIVGLYGLVGAGRTELLRAIFGADPLAEGTLYLKGKKQKVQSSKHAVQLGMGLVPENRKTEGAVLDLSIQENAILPSLSKFSNLSFLNNKVIASVVNDAISKLNVKTKDRHVQVGTLSGGNQQKVIISKWLLHESELLLFDEPTQGIDIGAKAEIYDIMKDLAETGTSIIVTSSELEELLRVCDRVLVMYDGAVINEFNDPNQYRSEILHAAVSGN